MRIISSFHDYYDLTLKHGFDESLVYLRETKKIDNLSQNEQKKYPNLRTSYSRLDNTLLQSIYYLGFCGKIYPIIRLISKDGNPDFLYSTDQVSEYLEKIGLSLSKKKDSYYLTSYDLVNVYSKNSLDNFFSNSRESFNLEKMTEIFFKYNTPIFLMKKNDNKIEIIINPSLKKINFQKQKDPVSVNQEISMFLGGVLNSKENKMIKISDKDKIHKHGFDKWSFRKKGSK